MTSGRSPKGMFSEGALIVVSVLLALSADAWWDRVQQSRRIDDHLAALTRDFDRMAEGAEASLKVADAGQQAGRRLLLYLRSPDAGIDADSAPKVLEPLFFYEVFTPSVGAYEAMSRSGDLEALDDNELKRALADFFGSFGDTQASEARLLEVQAAFALLPEFAELANTETHLRRYLENEDASYPTSPDAWRASAIFRNHLSLVTLAQYDLVDDYSTLKDRIDAIRERLVQS